MLIAPPPQPHDCNNVRKPESNTVVSFTVIATGGNLRRMEMAPAGRKWPIPAELTGVVVGPFPACGRVVAVHRVPVVADAELEVDGPLTQSPRNHSGLQNRGE